MTNWEVTKRYILQKWDKISQKDLDNTNNELSDILELLKKHYPGDDYDIDVQLKEMLEAKDEAFYEHNPTSPRSMETSEFQDEVQDLATRGPERSAYEKKVADDVEKRINESENEHG